MQFGRLESINTIKGTWTISCLTFIYAFLIRLPFFFRDYIDHDESTFILMAQSWIEGHLPYTHLWDLKPPLVFLMVAIPISIFGKSFIAIRLLGVIAVWVTALFSGKIAKKLEHGFLIQFWVAMLTVSLLSLFGSVQGTMSEHLSMAFLMPALFLIIKENQEYKFFIAGLLLGCTLMCKLNLGYAVLLVFMFVLGSQWLSFKTLKTLVKPIVMGIGLTLILLLLALPYIKIGLFSTWLDAVFMAPLAYTSGEGSVLKVFPILIILLVLFLFDYKFGNPQKNLLIWVVIIGVFISFVKTGKVNGHYLIQLYPLLLLLLIPLMAQLKWRKLSPFLGLLLVFMPIESYLETHNVIQTKRTSNRFWNGEGFSVPEYLMRNGLENKRVFYNHYHIGYWVQNQEPPTMVSTHPSNITRQSLYEYIPKVSPSPLEEIQRIMTSKKPEIVVNRVNKSFFQKQFEQENIWIDRYLNEKFQILDTVENAVIYQRLQKQ